MPIFHSLRVAAIDPLTDDAVALTFEVPEHLRDEYVFTAGQHLSIRGADEKRRSFSIFTPPSSGLLRVGIKVCREVRSARACSATCVSATSST